MKKKAIVTCILFGLIISCGGGKPPVNPEPSKGRPEWVDRGGGAFPGDQGIAFYGVGAADAITHPTVTSRRTASDLNARTDLARSFKTKISDLVKAYERVVSDAKMANVESFGQQATKGFTNITLTGAFIVDHYYDSNEKALYALSRMSVLDFKKQIEQMEQLAQEVQDVILDNAEEAFKELE